jgi:DNA-3-methyladenine glycosylase II
MEMTLQDIVTAGDVAALLDKDKVLSAIDEKFGNPPNWKREQGFVSLSKIILEQQVSLASAAAHFKRLDSYIPEFSPNEILKLSDDEWRSCHISRQKAGYLRALSRAVTSGSIVLENLEFQEESDIREKLTGIKGIGTWTADIYLLFCLQRKDILPLGDIAIITTIKKLYGVNTKEEAFILGERWKPLRSLAAYYLWHYYLSSKKQIPSPQAHFGL